jgi:hypothetical protein
MQVVLSAVVLLCFFPLCEPGVQFRARLPAQHTNVLRLRGGEKAAGGRSEDRKNIQVPMLNNLLAFSTALTNTTSEEHRNFGPMDPERLAFLRNAMNEMLENTTDVFRKAVDHLLLEEESPDNIALKLLALEDLNERVHHMDLAVGLRNMGGFPPVLNCLSCRNSSVRWMAADVVATCVQNNAELQQVVRSFLVTFVCAMLGSIHLFVQKKQKQSRIMTSARDRRTSSTWARSRTSRGSTRTAAKTPW